MSAARYARYFMRVHATNRNLSYGIPVEVIATNPREAATRAIDLAWRGQRDMARAHLDRVEDLLPDDHRTIPEPDSPASDERQR